MQKSLANAAPLFTGIANMQELNSAVRSPLLGFYYIAFMFFAIQDPVPVAWRSIFGFSHDSAQFSPPLEHKIFRAMEFHQSLRGGRYLVRFGFMQRRIERLGQ